jgi:AraC family transcriptional regulator
MKIRRIVTSYKAAGKAVVKTDEQLTAVPRVGAGIRGCEIWSTDEMPVVNSAAADAAQRARLVKHNNFVGNGGGTTFRINEWAAGHARFTHPTETVEYAIKYPVIAVGDQIRFEDYHTESHKGGLEFMSDSAREERTTAFEPSSYAIHQPVIEGPENYTDLDQPRQRPHQAATDDWAVQVSPPNAVSRRIARWPGMAVEIVQATRRGRIDYHFCAPMHMLVVHDRDVRHDGSAVIEGLPKATLQDCSRKLVLVPTGHRYHDWHEPRTLSRVVFVYFDPDQLAVIPELRLWSSSLAPRLYFEDGVLIETALKLASLIESGSDQRFYAQALGVVLAHELVKTGRDGAQPQASGGLAAWQRRKALAYIEEHLTESISLEALAELVGLSACYFCRAFGQSLGMPPQRYQLSRRIERAKALLAKHAASVTEVGLTLGYNDASAFCTAFRRITGLTPTAYRRSLS